MEEEKGYGRALTEHRPLSVTLTSTLHSGPPAPLCLLPARWRDNWQNLKPFIPREEPGQKACVADGTSSRQPHR